MSDKETILKPDIYIFNDWHLKHERGNKQAASKIKRLCNKILSRKRFYAVEVEQMLEALLEDMYGSFPDVATGQTPTKIVKKINEAATLAGYAWKVTGADKIAELKQRYRDTPNLH